MVQQQSTIPSLWGKAWTTEIGDGATWQDALTEAADVIAHHLDLLPRILADARSREEIFPEDIQSSAAVTAFELGIAIGFALAQTYPATIQGLADWPARAAEMADLESWPVFTELPPAREEVAH